LPWILKYLGGNASLSLEEEAMEELTEFDKLVESLSILFRFRKRTEVGWMQISWSTQKKNVGGQTTAT